MVFFIFLQSKISYFEKILKIQKPRFWENLKVLALTFSPKYAQYIPIDNYTPVESKILGDFKNGPFPLGKPIFL